MRLRLTGLLLAALCCFATAHAQTAPGRPQPAKATPTARPANPYYSRTDTTRLRLSDAQWRKLLPPAMYHVAREQGTERAFSGPLWNATGRGTYYCAPCGNALFRSDAKFASECGWPSFFEPLRARAVRYQADHSHGMERIEVLCGRCDAHLGHIFNDGPPPTYQRFCMNSLVLDFVPSGAGALGRLR
ncbi:peptide-methionine (R)-S-oxide reductase MsrB [Hymenobacter sp. B81]|uniref:peptide-methionine (R)-S-oxide reductase MsrB n=1 Tax=Hymenobacter sp. B81 TaxID=3344878 RepID=UPI0037DDD9C6